VHSAFSPGTATIGVGALTTITFNNQDDGVMHDLVVFDPSGGQVGATAIINGPASASIAFTPAVAGSYPFKCTVHPQQMRGVITAQ